MNQQHQRRTTLLCLAKPGHAEKILLALFLILYLGAPAQEIKITSDSCLSESCILARYYGKSLFPVDTFLCTPGQSMRAKTKETLAPGLYALIFTEVSKSDFLVADESPLSIHLKVGASVDAQVKGSRQSEVFSEYSSFMRAMHQKRETAVARYKAHAKYPDSVLMIRHELDALNADVRTYFTTNAQRFSGTLLGGIFAVLTPVNAPKVLSADEQRFYMKNHFFDHVNFSDARIVNTPFLINQLEVYLNEIVDPMPDSLVKYAVKVVDASMANNEVFKQVCNHVFSFASQSKIMGMDKMQVAISKRYYLSGKAGWTNAAFTDKLQELVNKAEPILIGNTAPDITLLSLNEEEGFVSLSDVKANYTLVFFWEPGCYHCQQAIPLIQEVSKQYPSNVLRVFAVYTQEETKEWNDFIFEHNLYHWIHVYDKHHQSQVKQVYDVASTPMLYLLDADKKIVAKKFDPKFLDPIVKQLLSSGSF